MSALSDVSDRVRGGLARVVGVAKQGILGQNNERLDFLMDSFYKLSPQQRNGALAVVIGVIFFFVFSAVALYFSRVSALEKELSDSFSALQQLKARKIDDQIEQKKFEKLVSSIERKTSKLSFKPFFEKLSREQNVEIKNLSEQPADLDADDPLSQAVKQVNVELRLPKISIPRLLNFIVDIEKAGHFLRVVDLKITGIYGNRLFFDTTLIVRGYTPKG